SGKWRPPHEERLVERIRQLERMLAHDGVRTLKIFLQIDAKTQHERIARLRKDKRTRWRVTREDRKYARHHDALDRAAPRCENLTNHRDAPWNVVDGTDEEYRLLAVGELLRDEMRVALRRGEQMAKTRPKPPRQSTTTKPRLRALRAPRELVKNDY